MSTLNGVTSTTGSNYATQLAQSSALARSLYSLGRAVENGNLSSAGSVLAALMKANPQYASSGSGSSSSSDPINQDFQALAEAISNNQPGAALTAWARLKTDLAKQGFTNISSGHDLAAKAVAQSKASMQQSLLTGLFSSSSSGSSSVSTLLGGAGDTATSASAVDNLVSNWLTYKASGTPSSGTNQSGGSSSGLNTAA